jgi:hypothetical protein
MINGKIYIGINTNNRSGYFGSGINITRAIKKYGKQNFKKEILEECKTIKELSNREKYYIKLYNATELGYNISPGGTGVSDEMKQKVSRATKGRRLTKEWKHNISIAMQGKKLSKEHKQSISKGNTGKIRSDECKLAQSIRQNGIPCSDTVKRKLSDYYAQKRLKRGNNNECS